LTAVKVLRYILENPQRSGIRLTTPRSREELDRLKTDLEVAIRKYLVYPYGVEDASVGGDPDAKALYALLKNAYDEGKVQVVLFAKSPSIPGVPGTFLGSPKNVYAEGGVKKSGYAVSLAELVRIFLAGGEETEDKGNGETTGEPRTNGGTP
jgi:hypothetical protein